MPHSIPEGCLKLAEALGDPTFGGIQGIKGEEVPSLPWSRTLPSTALIWAPGRRRKGGLPRFVGKLTK